MIVVRGFSPSSTGAANSLFVLSLGLRVENQTGEEEITAKSQPELCHPV